MDGIPIITTSSTPLTSNPLAATSVAIRFLTVPIYVEKINERKKERERESVYVRERDKEGERQTNKRERNVCEREKCV